MTQPHISMPSASHPHVIGLTGPIECGKDTVAGLLQIHANGYTLAFADALRQEIVDAFGIDPSMLTQRETKEHPMSALALHRCLDHAFVARMVAHYRSGLHDGGIEGEALDLSAPRSPRQVMQWWGTEYRRNQDPCYWVVKAVAHMRLAHWLMDPPLFVLSDVRFPDEAIMVRHLGGKIWKIKRPGCGVPAGAHKSEVTGAEFAPDVIINNRHDIEHLQQMVLRSYYVMHGGAEQGSEVPA